MGDSVCFFSGRVSALAVEYKKASGKNYRCVELFDTVFARDGQKYLEPGESAARFGVDRAGVDASGGVPGEFRGLGVFRGAAQFISKARELAGDDWPR